MQNIKSTTPQLNRPNIESFKSAEKTAIEIILDNVRSAQNIGSIFRTADAFNVQKIILTGISAVPPNKEILKTALGATESVAWEYQANPVNYIKDLQFAGKKVYAIEQTQRSIPLQEFAYTEAQELTIIFGNEVDGVSQELIDLCDGSIEIPQFGTKHSLNVAVTAGIVIWHLINQLLQNKK